MNWDSVARLFAAAIETPREQREAVLGSDPDEAVRAETRRLLARHEELSMDSASTPFLQAVDLRLAAGLVDGPEAGDPALIGRFEIIRRLGRGATGIVYLARDPALGRNVALKLMAPYLSANPVAVRRFTEEARAASGLDHPRIVGVHEIGRTVEDRLFIAMAYHEGETLRDRIAGGPLPVVEATRIAGEIAEGLAAAHANGIVHRDIKPENILLTARGARIVDFGIAKVAGQTLTRTGAPLGTASYMSPEQTRGAGVDHRADLWSLGVVLYEMLTGVRPFRAEGGEALVYSVRHDVPEPPSVLRPEVPAAVDQVIRRCLEKDPADRYATASHFAEALIQPRLASQLRPRRLRPVAMAAVSLILALGVLTVLIARGPAREPAPAYTILAEVGGSAHPEVRRAVRSLISAGLHQASVLVPVGDEEARQGLTRMERPDTMPLDASTARELAYRGAVRTVVLASLDQVGRTFALTLQVIDVETGSVIGTEQATASSEDALIPAADGAIRRLHRRVGARRSELRAARPLVEATTASFEAYRKFVRAVELSGSLESGAGQLLREALALDSMFAGAWRLLAVRLENFAPRDSVLAAVRRLERLADRGTEWERLRNAATAAGLRGNHDIAVAIYDRLLRDFGPDPSVLNARGLHLTALGRPEEGAQSVRLAIEHSRFGPVPTYIGNLGQQLVRAGRAGEAKKVVDSLNAVCGSSCSRVPFASGWGQTFAVMLDDWARAESLVTTGVTASSLRASLHARRGEFRAASEALARMPPQFRLRGVGDLMVALVTGRPWTGPPAVALPSILDSLAWRGVWEAVAGDTAAARQLARLVRDSFPAGAYRGAAPEFIEAAVAARAGQWKAVVHGLGPVAAGTELGRLQAGVWIGALPIRWLVATAYEHQGQLDSAVAMYERVLWPAGDYLVHLGMRGIPYSVAHHRLVLLYARMGRLDEARQHWKSFSEAFTNPDPEFRHLLEEARQAIRREVARPAAASSGNSGSTTRRNEELSA